MAFAIAVANLIEVMKQPGCPVCRLERRAARKAVDSFLWENLMNPGVREQVIGALGFCPPHTLLLAGKELASTGLPVGVNLVYETLNRRISRELRQWNGAQRRTSRLHELLNRIGMRLPASPHPLLPPASPCMICEIQHEAGQNALNACFEEMERGTPDLLTAFQSSDGFCLPHLRRGLESFSLLFPAASNLLTEWTAARLESQSALMQEFIRKKNWEYRSEALSAEEANAWRAALTFFTGYAGDDFQFDMDED